jgi:hypothetical protein
LIGDGQGREDMESVIEIVLIVLLFPLGVLLGYRWRDRISQQHRAQYKAERFVREQREGLMQERERRSRRDISSISEAIIELVEIDEEAA